METSFLWFGVFSGSFGVRSIVPCKCSGKYIDIYFKLKITYVNCFCYDISYLYYMSVCCPSSAGYQSGLHKSRDVRECQPGVTTGESRMFQALVVPDWYPAGLSASLHRLGFM